MFRKFERKLTHGEYTNLTKLIKIYFSTEDHQAIAFTRLMEFGNYLWSDKFENKLALIFDTPLNVLLPKKIFKHKTEAFHTIKSMILENEGNEKTYFLFKNFHKCPQMWRLNDSKCIWGVGVHESYAPLQSFYCKQLEEIEDINKKSALIESVSKFVTLENTMLCEFQPTTIVNYKELVTLKYAKTNNVKIPQCSESLDNNTLGVLEWFLVDGVGYYSFNPVVLQHNKSGKSLLISQQEDIILYEDF